MLRLTNQKVPESPVENCNIPAENTFTVNKRREVKISG